MSTFLKEMCVGNGWFLQNYTRYAIKTRINHKFPKKVKKSLDLFGGIWYIDYTSPRVFFLCVFSLPFRSNGNKIGHLRGNAIENQASGRGRILTAEEFRRG
jgi:hypothetical protein